MIEQNIHSLYICLLSGGKIVNRRAECVPEIRYLGQNYRLVYTSFSQTVDLSFPQNNLSAVIMLSKRCKVFLPGVKGRAQRKLHHLYDFIRDSGGFMTKKILRAAIKEYRYFFNKFVLSNYTILLRIFLSF